MGGGPCMSGGGPCMGGGGHPGMPMPPGAPRPMMGGMGGPCMGMMRPPPVEPLPTGPVTFAHLDGFGKNRSPDEIRIMRELLDEDVDRFIQDSKVDEAAARALKTQTPDIQWIVIQKTISFSTNPSASLVGRIRDAKRGVTPGGPPGPRPPQPPTTPAAPQSNILPGADTSNMNEVDRFIAENNLDVAAVNALKAESPETQTLVINHGPLVNCHNPSGVVIGRIRSAKAGTLAPRGPAMPPPGAPPSGGNPMQTGGLNVPMPGAGGGMPAIMGSTGGAMSASELNDEAMKAIAKLNQI